MLPVLLGETADSSDGGVVVEMRAGGTKDGASCCHNFFIEDNV